MSRVPTRLSRCRCHTSSMSVLMCSRCASNALSTVLWVAKNLYARAFISKSLKKFLVTRCRCQASHTGCLGRRSRRDVHGTCRRTDCPCLGSTFQCPLCRVPPRPCSSDTQCRALRPRRHRRLLRVRCWKPSVSSVSLRASCGLLHLSIHSYLSLLCQFLLFLSLSLSLSLSNCSFTRLSNSSNFLSPSPSYIHL